jgi:hypothetical protein
MKTWRDTVKQPFNVCPTPCHTMAEAVKSPASDHISSGLCLGQSTWDLRTTWHWGRFFSEFFGFPDGIIPLWLHTHISSAGWTIWPLVAAEREHSLTPGTWKFIQGIKHFCTLNWGKMEMCGYGKAKLETTENFIKAKIRQWPLFNAIKAAQIIYSRNIMSLIILISLHVKSK